VGDDEHGLLRIGGEDAGIERLFGLFVETAADLVEEEDVTAVEQSAGDGDTLGLPLAESTAQLIATSFGISALLVKHRPTIDCRAAARYSHRQSSSVSGASKVWPVIAALTSANSLSSSCVIVVAKIRHSFD
jgi:hypothetical protein